MICWNQSCSCNRDFPSHLYISSVIASQAPTSHSRYPFSLVSVFPLTNILYIDVLTGTPCSLAGLVAGSNNLSSKSFRARA
jgi:hypothetical protein